MATKTFEDYFASKGDLPAEELVDGDDILVLRSSTVFRGVVKLNSAFASMTGNASATTINTLDVWEAIAGTLVDIDSTSTLTFAANQYTYTGPNQTHKVKIRASISLAGGDESYQVGIFVNSVQVGDAMTAKSSATGIAFIQTTVAHALQTGDVIEMMVRNTEGTEDCTVSDAQLEIG
jgi:hypothetical protein